MSQQDPSETDTALIKRLTSGDESAFSKLIETYYEMIYRTAYKWSGSQHEAEDIAQEACIKIGRSIGQFRGDCALKSWIYRIVVNLFQDTRRKDKNYISLDQEGAHALSANGALETDVTHHQMWQQVRALPEKQRDAFLLIYSEGVTHAQAAEIMGCAETTVSWHIHEGKKQLKKIMNSDE